VFGGRVLVAAPTVRTGLPGSAAIRSAIALADEVIAPALGQARLDPAMIQLVRLPARTRPGRWSASPA